MEAPVRRHRIFIAVWVDPVVQGEIVALERRLEQAGVHLRWIQAHNLHFTVRFLGEVTTAQVAQIRVATRDAARSVSPFRLTLHGVGAFPSLERPQVVWIGVRQGGDQLAALSTRLNAALAAHRFPPEDRPFAAHLTLARVRGRREWGGLVRGLSGFRDAAVGSQEVEAVTVVESHLGPRGPRYEPLEEVPLSQGLKSSS